MLRMAIQKITISQRVVKIGGHLMKLLIPMSLFVLLGAGQPAIAQGPAPAMGMGMGAGPTAMDERFYSTVPGVGELVPDVQVVNDGATP